MEPSKCKKRTNELDRISQLPNGSLIHILSLLTMKEAARTSLLSTRWRDLWTQSTGSFDFDGLNASFWRDSTSEYDFVGLDLYEKSIVARDFKTAEALWKANEERCEKRLQVERNNFVTWVNRVLNSHRGATMDELRVRLDLDSSCTSDIDSWVRYAFEKRVKRLELNFKLPHKLMLEEHYSLTMQSLDFSRVTSLISIRFAYVDVTAECLECFQANSPCLEEISVDHSHCLVNLKVFGPSIKKLKVISCRSLEGIEISAKNLASLQYFGPEINLCFKSACHLSGLSLGGSCRKLMNHRRFSELSCYFSQLQSLVLRYHQSNMNFQKFPELRNLKKFKLEVRAYGVGTFLPWIFLIEACPSLYSFTIVADISIDKSEHLPLNWPNWVEPVPEKRLLKCPKVVEFVGFTSHGIDGELVTYFLENVVALEKMTIDTRKPGWIGTELENLEDQNRLEAKRCAMELQTKLTAGVELKIL